MKNYLLIILVLLSGLIPLQRSIKAQESISLAKLEIDLWPEYDNSQMLVIYHITLTKQTALPATLSFRIPARVVKPNAVAARQADGSLINASYSQKIQGDWLTITAQATSPEIQLEYYDPSLVKKEDDRHFVFNWPGDYKVKSMVVQVQQPIGATNMHFSPDLGKGQAANDGMIYYTSEIGELPQADTFSITMDYERPIDVPSSSSLTVKPSAPITDHSSFMFSSLTSITSMPWPLVVLFLLLIALVGFLFGFLFGFRFSHLKPIRAGIVQGLLQIPSGNVSSKDEPQKTVYCHQCGKRANPGDQYCRVCGVELRLS